MQSKTGQILLLHSDPVVLESVAKVLTGEGYVVYPVVTGEGALRILRVTPIDLAMVDLDFPDKTGWEVFHNLKTEFGQLPILLVTAEPNLLALALKSGAAELMEKPLDFPEFLRKVDALLWGKNPVSWQKQSQNFVAEASLHVLPD